MSLSIPTHITLAFIMLSAVSTPPLAAPYIVAVREVEHREVGVGIETPYKLLSLILLV